MCTPERPCQVLDYDDLRALTLAVTASPGWRGRPVEVGRLYRPGLDGTATGRFIRYPTRAPACTVPHELAHVLSHDDDHGDRWRQAYLRLGRLVGDVWASRLASRGPA